ncbi:MAG: LysM peptidoglycan-binding domain-containing protein [Caldilineaceae bacterium]|nr:LysM peptidoglycan-binding domain-containing protein [Caldilineaceae bacterium]MDE0311537.1 LysM peptidoglycan-binding domain-containing protein [Caldilineaceae bacterium]
MKLGVRLAFLLIALLFLLQIVSVSAQESGYTYIVQPGDSWPLVAQRVGLTVSQLQEANPDSIRPNGWLIVGESLFVPWSPDGDEEYYIVQRGEGWISVAEKFGVPVNILQAANPKSVRPNESLLVGERLLIPAGLVTPTGVPTPVPTAAPVDTRVALQVEAPAEGPSPIVTPTPVLDILSLLSSDSDPEPFFMPRISLPLPRRVTLPPCPDARIGLGQTLTDLFRIPTYNRHAQLTSFLGDCGFEFRLLVNADLTSDDVDDAVLVFTNAEEGRNSAVSEQKGRTGADQQELVILDGGEGHSLSYKITATGTIDLLATQDINADGLTDVVWTDTVCGPSSCFVTVHVRSWDGIEWRDWTKGTITMAGANVSLTPSDKPGRPNEIRLIGGQYAGAGAGPQRARLAVWASTAGAPYALSSERMMPSLCLYHTVVDANHAMTHELYLEKAQWLYTDAAENQNLQACGERSNELAELRSFALFRLALIAGYESKPDLAAERVERLASTYERQVFAEVGVRWLAAYRQSSDARTACEAVYNFAATNSEVVDILADYGYANPTFTAEEVCPYLEIKQDEEPETRLTETEGLPVCPENVAEYLAVLPEVTNELTGRQSTVGDSEGQRQEGGILKLRIFLDAWLQSCDAMGNGRGGLLVYDLNQDGLKDVIAMPSVVSDDGYGPGGADGVVLILHQRDDGSFEPVYAPEIEGLPSILAIGDANGDGRAELFWQLERCTTFCLLTVEAITWESETAAYQSVIGPGATIAEGAVTVDIVEDESSDLPRVRRLWFSGGVSGREEKGLVIPHTEIWYSMDGSPLRRHTWSYDRANDASTCLGLRLIEANIALQSAGPEGNKASYATAIELYKDALESPDLQPCSVQGTDPEEEEALLRGLANFRLVQVLTLNNQRSEAESLLESLEEEHPENRYTEAAAAWLAAYTSVPNPVAACASVMSIFLDSPELWQITEEFGRDHPSLNMRQVCYAPNSGEDFEFRLTPNW